jgi:hypothetical protein
VKTLAGLEGVSDFQTILIAFKKDVDWRLERIEMGQEFWSLVKVQGNETQGGGQKQMGLYNLGNKMDSCLNMSNGP